MASKLQRRRQALKIRCHRIINVDRITNDEVQGTIRQDSGPLEDFITTRQKEKIEIVWILHRSQQYFHCRPTRYRVRQKKRRQTAEENALTNKLNLLENPSQRLRHWHATGTFGGSWSGAHLRNDITIPSDCGTDDDDDNDDDDDDFIIDFLRKRNVKRDIDVSSLKNLGV